MFNYVKKFFHITVIKPKGVKFAIKKQCNKKFSTSNIISPNLKVQNCRFLYLSSSKNVKLFVDSENLFAYKVLESFPIATFSPNKIETDKIINSENEFNTFLNQNWRSATASDITKAFLNVVDYCQNHNIPISDERFNKLVDGLMDNVEKLTTSELYTLLECLIKLPPTDSFNSHNFHDIWSALDDICCWRLKNWDLDTLYKFAEQWYHLNLGRISNYLYEFLEKLSKKPERLTQQQLVHALFYTNICRKRPIEFAFDYAIEQKLSSLSIDEMAIIAMGYFKTQTKVKLPTILNRMIDLVMENADSVHDISLAAIIKIIRLSQHPAVIPNIYKMLDKLVPQIDRLSNICMLHIALAGTNSQIFHRPILETVAQKFVNNVSDIKAVRLKDIERLLMVMTMFDFDPKTTPDFYETLLKELHRDERDVERIRHPKCIPYALTFLSIRNMYSEKLMNKVLHPEFTTEVYGKASKMLPRELFSLDLSREIDLPNYNGNKWTNHMRYKASKWLVEYLPNIYTKKKLSAAEKLIFDIVDTVHKITGNKNYLHIDHVLPHYAKPDLILCIDKSTNQFVEPTGFHNYILGDIKRPHSLENLKWYSIVSVSYNLLSRNNQEPLGHLNMKKRQLTAIGYEPILVKYTEYMNLSSDEKVDFILNKLKLL